MIRKWSITNPLSFSNTGRAKEGSMKLSVRLENLRIIDNRDRGSKEKGITNSSIVIIKMKMANNCLAIVESMLASGRYK